MANKGKNRKDRKDYGMLKLSFEAKRTFSPTEDGIGKGIRYTECELECSLNLDVFEKTFGKLTKAEYARILYRNGFANKTSCSCSGNGGCGCGVRYEPQYRFTAKGKALCSETDSFSKKKGEMLAESRAKKDAYLKVEKLAKELYGEYMRKSKAFYMLASEMRSFVESENDHVEYVLRNIH